MRYQAHDIEEVDDDGGVASCVGVVLRDAVQSFWVTSSWFGSSA